MFNDENFNTKCESVKISTVILLSRCNGYREPPTISPELILFCKLFLMGLYKGGLIYGGGAYTWTIFCVSVIIVINKYSNSDKQA
jgi:hypothetical protein